MGSLDFKTKTFFDVAPKEGKAVFMDVGIVLDRIIMISEPVMVRDLHYTFTVHFDTPQLEPVTFEYKRKADCIMAQREMTRAWTKTGEFSDEDMVSGKENAVQ